MTEIDSPKPSRRASRRSEPRTLLRFVEELSWLLSSYDDLDFKALGALGSELNRTQRAATNLKSHSIQRQHTTQLLVGSLPGLLTDENLFPSNEDIIEFSTMTLGITIPRWQKKSKYELIGHIVCQTENAEKSKIDSLVQALNSIMNDKGDVRKKLEDDRKLGLSWNEVIQKLLNTAK